MIDLLIVAVIGGIAFLVAQDGALGAVTTFFCVTAGGAVHDELLRAAGRAAVSKAGPFFALRGDVIALLGLFAVTVTGMRLACEQIAPRMLQLPTLPYEVLRWGFGAATGYVTVGILLVAVHVSPLPRQFWGFTPERKNILAFDDPAWRWLGFTRYATDNAYARRKTFRDQGGAGTGHRHAGLRRPHGDGLERPGPAGRAGRGHRPALVPDAVRRPPRDRRHRRRPHRRRRRRRAAAAAPAGPAF